MKGQLEGFPPEVVEKMLEYQVAQGNPRDVSVFEKDVGACLGRGGFNWESTPEGTAFWDNVLGFPGLKHRFAMNFYLFFKTYPMKSETMNKPETAAGIAVLKEMVAQATSKIEALEAQLKSTDVVTRYPVCGDPELMISGETAAYIFHYSGVETPAMSLCENAAKHWVDKTGKKVSGNLYWVRK